MPISTYPLDRTPRLVADFAAMGATDREVLVRAARDIQAATRAATDRQALWGKNLAVLCDAVDEAALARFGRAASRLGAKVVRLNTVASKLDTPHGVARTAPLLGRLYDAIECLDIPPDLVRQIGDAAGVPTFEAISSERHPIADLAARLDAALPLDDRHCAVLQAVLVGVLA